MDIDFPLILVLLVAASGLLWLYDRIFLAGKRQQAIAEVKQRYAEREDDSVYQEALNAASKEPTVIEYAKSFFPVLFVVLVLRSFLVEPFQIPSASMVPTLKVGDFILVNKFTYGLRLPVVGTKILDINEPARGDVMVFFPPHDDRYFIKRVIAVPGDEVRIDNGTLYLNGERQEQTFVANVPPIDPQYQLYREQLGEVDHLVQKRVVPGPYSRNGQWLIPEGHYFLMGDNRDNSSDSRVWGPVPEANIVGKAFAIWMHWESLTSLPSFNRVGSID